MEALILAMIIAYAVKKAAGDAHDHWQGSKSANRKASRGKPASWRARSAARHDTAYWAEQVRGGFPQVRHGLYMGWNAGRIAQLEGKEARAERQAEHAEERARVTEAVREHRRRRDEALERIYAAASQQSPDPDGEDEPAAQDDPGARECHQCSRPLGPGDTGFMHDACRERFTRPRGFTPPPSPPNTKGTVMSGDTTYREQMAELEAIRSSAEEEVNSTRRKMMTSRLDILQNLGLDAASLAEAAAIDDALQAQEKAARQTLDAADAAISGLKKRHGGIQEAVDSAPVDKPADPDFYTD